MTHNRKRPHMRSRSFSNQIKERVLRVQKHQVRHPNIQTAPQVHKGEKLLAIDNENMAKRNLESLKKKQKLEEAEAQKQLLRAKEHGN